MKMTTADLDQLRSAFSICRTAGIDAVVITENQVRGVAPTGKMAIISPVSLTFDDSIKLGIGRIAELEKRLSIFSGDIAVEGKTNDSNEVSVLSLKAGKSSVQFRCTAERMIKYPKANEDPEVATITATKAEISQISRAVKTLGAESLTLAIGRDGTVRFECMSPTNEAFVTTIDSTAQFVDENRSIVHTYEGDRFATVLDASVRDADEVQLTLGDFGSLTLMIKGHVLLALPEANQENDDE